jgi:DNA-binding response OmpR family regulator
MAKILLIEDDAALVELLKDWLTLDQHVVESAGTRKEGAVFLRCYRYDLVILDWALPDGSGPEILSEYRATGGKTPVLMLTGRRTVEAIESGLDAGADDYLTKPFDIREFKARVKALLRRATAYTGKTLKVRDILLETDTMRVTKGDREIKLVPTEFAVFEFLMRHQDQVFSAEALLNRIWASSSEATVQAITTCIKRIRKKMDVEGGPSIIKTVHGAGYKIEP